MNLTRPASELRLIGLAFVASLIAVITAGAVPALSTASFAANEASAIASLQLIASAEAQVKSAVDIDTNCDGVGEYAFLSELAGRRAIRVCYGGVPAAGIQGQDQIHPPLLPPPFGDIHSSVAHCSGYLFQLWLPSHLVANELDGVAEDFAGGKVAAPFPGETTGARYWCCYAWPIDADVTGKRAFFINQDGILLQCANGNSRCYSGIHKKPGFGEAFENPLNMSSALRIGPPAAGADHTIWTKLQP